jgi:signal transduction histidine kinase
VLAAGCLALAVAQAAQSGPWNASHPRNWIVALFCGLLGIRVIAHTRKNAVGWLLLVMGEFAAINVAADAWSSVRAVAWIGTWAWWPTCSLLPVLALVFPSGQPPSRRWLPILAVGIGSTFLGIIGLGWASWPAPATFWQDAVQGTARRGWPLGIALAGVIGASLGLLTAILSLGVRWRRASGDGRRLVAWALAFAVVTLVAFVFEAYQTMWSSWVVGAAALPVAALVAILRYGLYDIDLIIHRSLLYGMIVVILVAVYTAVVLVISAFLPDYGQVIGTVVVVLGFAPLHRVLSRNLDRWLYGDRANPYAALSRLATYLESPVPRVGVFAAVVKAVAEALKVPYVAVRLNTGSQVKVLAEHGRSRAWSQLQVPITHRGVSLGVLVAEARSPEERLGRRERLLLTDLARHAAPSARAEQLHHELQCAKSRLIRDREERLRRIELDIHDSVGAGLAGTRLQVDAARKLLAGRDVRVERLLESAIGGLGATSDQSRQLVHNVWLSELRHGLLAAINEQADRFKTPDFDVRVTVAGHIGRLPAAVEMAAYRITGEALANTVKHARARSCQIRLRQAGNLELEIVDDGQGIPQAVLLGVGLASMRARCEELCGTLHVETDDFGTKIRAWMPLEDPPAPVASLVDGSDQSGAEGSRSM